VNPWDEDADIYLIGEDRASVERKLRAVVEEHGFELVYDARDFFLGASASVVGRAGAHRSQPPTDHPSQGDARAS
jgi:hypothetical protein